MALRQEISSRERILSTLKGEETDRFPVWLKLANQTWRGPQPQEVRRLSDVDLLRAAECDLLLGASLAYVPEYSQVELNVQESAGTRTTTYRLSGEELVAVDGYSNDSWHPLQYPVETPEQLELLGRIFEDREYRVEPRDAADHRDKQNACVALDAVTFTGIGPGPLMDLIEHWCGPVATVYLMTDYPDLFDATVQTMHECRIRELEAVLPHTKADTFWLTENTSTSLISPGMFEKYCVPNLTAYGNLILDYGLIPIHHMCGTLNALLEVIDGLPAIANEAYTTRPLGDVSLTEGKTRMPSMALIGGTNATLWMAEPDEIVAAVEEDLESCPDRRGIFLTSAGVLPPIVSVEKAGEVASRLKELPN